VSASFDFAAVLATLWAMSSDRKTPLD